MPPKYFYLINHNPILKLWHDKNSAESAIDNLNIWSLRIADIYYMIVFLTTKKESNENS